MGLFFNKYAIQVHLTLNCSLKDLLDLEAVGGLTTQSSSNTRLQAVMSLHVHNKRAQASLRIHLGFTVRSVARQLA